MHTLKEAKDRTCRTYANITQLRLHHCGGRTQHAACPAARREKRCWRRPAGAPLHRRCLAHHDHGGARAPAQQAQGAVTAVAEVSYSWAKAPLNMSLFAWCSACPSASSGYAKIWHWQRGDTGLRAVKVCQWPETKCWMHQRSSKGLHDVATIGSVCLGMPSKSRCSEPLNQPEGSPARNIFLVVPGKLVTESSFAGCSCDVAGLRSCGFPSSRTAHRPPALPRSTMQPTGACARLPACAQAPLCGGQGGRRGPLCSGAFCHSTAHHK